MELARAPAGLMAEVERELTETDLVPPVLAGHPRRPERILEPRRLPSPFAASSPFNRVSRTEVADGGRRPLRRGGQRGDEPTTAAQVAAFLQPGSTVGALRAAELTGQGG